MEDMRRNLIELTGTLRRREAEAQAVLGGIVEGVYAVDQEPHHPLPQPAGRAAAGGHARAGGRPLLRRRAQAARRRTAGARASSAARSCRRASDGSAQRHRAAAGRPRASRAPPSSPAPRMVEGLQVQVIRDETELEAVRRARDSVLANISHEFRTPLAAQLASIELLRDGLDDAAAATSSASWCCSLERGTLRLTQLIDNLLESVRIESGQLAIRQQSVDARGGGRGRPGAGRLAAGAARPDARGGAAGGPARSSRATSRGSRRCSSTCSPMPTSSRPKAAWCASAPRPATARVRAWVEDEGAGPAAADGEAMFARFRRGDERAGAGGLGLGLWIVKSIVERHGGTRRLRAHRGRAARASRVTLPAEPPA